MNVSCGGDYEASYLHGPRSRRPRSARRAPASSSARRSATRATLPGHPVLPPASAPSVLTVGGLDDQNRLAFAGYDMYHSSYGPTVDGLQKPEVIAPGIWVAAPILPGTPDRGAGAAAVAPGRRARRRAEGHHPGAPGRGLRPRRGRRASSRRSSASSSAAKMKGNNVISGAYKHVDGTSFAAPIVASIAAQMIEANPALTPAADQAPAHRDRAPHPGRGRRPAGLGRGGRGDGRSRARGWGRKSKGRLGGAPSHVA